MKHQEFKLGQRVIVKGCGHHPAIVVSIRCDLWHFPGMYRIHYVDSSDPYESTEWINSELLRADGWWKRLSRVLARKFPKLKFLFGEP